MNRKPWLVIPSAKLIPRELQNLGKLPAVIYPVNQKMVFDYLYELYKDRTEAIRVICYEGADKVEAQLDAYQHVEVQTLKKSTGG